MVPRQPQRAAISLSGTGYQLRTTWCAPAACWMLDIMDQGGNPLVQGVPLITGSGLLEQYAYLGITGELLVQTDNDPDAVPTFDSLGVLGHIYYVSNPE